MYKLIDLGYMDTLETQTVYSAVARQMSKENSRDTIIIICMPRDPAICIGYHQHHTEVDTKLPVIRREIGGGAVYLEKNQVFYQIVMPSNGMRNPRPVYKKFLQPAIDTLHELEIKGKYVPDADIWVGNKKISGNAGGRIADADVIAGNLLIDFDLEVMKNSINIGDDAKELFLKGMKRYMTTIKQNIGDVNVNININEIKKNLIEKFNYHFDVEYRSLKDEELKLMEKLNEKYLTDRWIEMKDYVLSKSRKGIKVAENTYIHEIKYDNENTAVMVQNGIIIDSQIKDLVGKTWSQK